MKISEKTISAVKNIPVEAVISRFVSLKRAGSEMVGLCPFHNERTPSFIVSPTKGFYKCFGCGVAGDGIRFVMEHEKKTFIEAIEYLAKEHIITVEYEEGKAPDLAEKEKRLAGLRQLQEKAMEYFLSISPKAIRYIKSREFTAQTTREWKLGYAASGFFEGRLIFPIENTEGDVVGFGGRAMDDSEPKYRNSPTSEYYDKSTILFGLSRARKVIQKSGFAIITEGYTDVIRMHQYGWKEAVATCGTALTEQQCLLLRKFTNTVYIMRDGDKAGLKATQKDLDILSHHFGNIMINILPKGEDPDSLFAYIERGGWHTCLHDAMHDAFIWQCCQWLDEISTGDIIKTASAIGQCAELLSRLQDQLQCELYVDMLCKRYKLNKSQFKKALTKRQQKETGSLFPDDEIPEWVNLARFYQDGFVMNNIKEKDQVGIYFKTDNRPITRLTNYTVKPLFFIMDPKDSRRLIEIYNGYKSYVIELTNRALISMDAFEIEIAGRPGFYSEPGFSKIHFKRLANWLNENTVTVFELKTLGWQPEGFFAFSNKVVVPSQVHQNGTLCGLIEYDEYGIATVNEQHFLSPGISKLNVDMRAEDNIYENDLYLKYAESPIKFEEWAKLFCDVYDNHGPIGLAFIFISAFKDIITREAKQPIPYFYGPKGSGKSAMGESMMRFFFSGKNSDGKLIQAYNLNPGQGTQFSFFNRMQRFRNVFMLFNEYDPNNIEVWKRGAFKSVYDGEGREVGNGETYKKRKTEIQKIQCVPGTAGQYLDTTDDASVYSRSVPMKFSLEKNKARTDEDKTRWKRLNDLEHDGISSLAASLYEYRDHVQKSFKEMFWQAQQKLNVDLRKKHAVAEPRIVNNYAVCLAIIAIMGQKLKLPFDLQDFYHIIFRNALDQIKLLKDNNLLANFWQTLEVIFDDGLFTDGTHFKIKRKVTKLKKDTVETEIPETDIIFIRLNLLHDKFAKRIREKTNIPGPDIETILTHLKDQPYFIGWCHSERFKDKITSAFMLDYGMLQELGYNFVKDEIIPPTENNLNKKLTGPKLKEPISENI